MFRQHGGLKENGPQAHVLGWSPVGDAVWEGLGGVGPDQPAAQSPQRGSAQEPFLQTSAKFKKNLEPKIHVSGTHRKVRTHVS